MTSVLHATEIVPAAQAINELVPNERPYGLCPAGEPRLAQAIEDKALIVVNGLMLVKAVGDTVGIALREEQLNGGMTELEVWYEIFYENNDFGKRQAIRRAFCQGEISIDLPGVTKWMKLRDVNSGQVCPGQDVTSVARQTAMSLQYGAPMPDNQTRKEYFLSHNPWADPL